VFFVDAAEVAGTTRDVRHHNYRTLRLLLASDPSPVSLTDITLKARMKDTFGYPDRTVIAYCLSGAATAVDLDTGVVHLVGPGTLWVAPP
jgi:L-ectoine synthase